MNNKVVEEFKRLSKVSMMATRDWDKDRVPNIVDCRPRNAQKQGLAHTLARKFGGGKVKEWGEKGICLHPKM